MSSAKGLRLCGLLLSHPALVHSVLVVSRMFLPPLHALQDVWGELLGLQSSQDDRHPPLDALSQVRSTDVKPAGTAQLVSFQTAPATLCQIQREPSMHLAPGPSAPTVPGFAQLHSITPRASSKQQLPRSSALSLIPREASSPHQQEQEGEFPPGSDRLPR